MKLQNIARFSGFSSLVVCPISGAVFFNSTVKVGKKTTKAAKAAAKKVPAKKVEETKTAGKAKASKTARLSKEVSAAIAALRVASSQVGETHLGRGVQTLRKQAVTVLKAVEEVKSSNTQAFKEYYQGKAERACLILNQLLRACGIFLA